MTPEPAPPTPPTPPPYGAPPPPPYGPPPPRPPRRLTRSSHDHMIGGVAGGMAAYFEIDPALIRLMWVAAAVVTGGVAVPLYFLAWIILPRDDRPPMPGQQQWRDWSREFHAETQRLAEEARRVTGEWREPVTSEATSSSTTSETYDPATGKGTTQVSYTEPWSAPPTDVDQHRHHGHNARSAGIVLVGLGIIFLASNAGWFAFVDWHTMWPVIFIGLGLVLLARQTSWGR